MPHGMTILIADQDEFESGYIASALTAAGAVVIGPFRSRSELAIAIGAGPDPRAIIIGARLADGTTWDLAERMCADGIDHLVLIGSVADEEGRDLTDMAVLRRPFAAYQVVEWAEALACGSGGSHGQRSL